MISLASLRSSARSVLLGLAFATSVIVAFGFHVLAWTSGGMPDTLLRVLFHLVMLVGYGALWIVAVEHAERNRHGPARTFWALTLFALGATVASVLTLLVARPPAAPEGVDPELLLGFDLDSGTPIVLAAVFKMNALGLVKGIFAVVLLARLRLLVLVKRTRTSQRNWNLMLTMMAVSAIATAFTSAGSDTDRWQTVLLIAALVLMVVNSFRLSWIVSLSFRQKMTAAGLSLLLLLVLVAGLGVGADAVAAGAFAPGSHAYLEHFSYPLSSFFEQSILFGILYCSTTILSLLFHLPTTGDFQQRAGERAAMHSLAHQVGDVFDAARLHEAISRSPVDAGCAHAAWLTLHDEEATSLHPRPVHGHGVDVIRMEHVVDHDALYDQVAADRKPVVLEQAVADHRIKALPGDGIGSLVAAPLIARDRVLGVLFASKNVALGFERDEVETIALLAAQGALAIENSRLFKQQVERERLARELSIAREVQRRLLPQNLPDVPGVGLAAAWASAHEVGGDYYDFVRLDEHRLGLIVADVSGKGTSAAFYMAEMQGIFQSASRLAPSPTEFLTHANLALADSLERNVFITCIYGVLDTREETLVLGRAGHCPAASVHLAGGATFLRSGGMGLGLDRSDLFRRSLTESRIRLQPGDVFALYTDGVVESRNASQEEFGYDRLLAVLERNRHEDAHDIHDAVLKELSGFLGDKDYDDDMTLVVLKWHGITGSRPTTGRTGRKDRSGEVFSGAQSEPHALTATPTAPPR